VNTKVLLAIIGSAIIFFASLIVIRNPRADDTFEVAAPPPTASLTDGMARLNVHTALLVQSLQIKTFPVWSPDARFLGVLSQGQWFKLDTSAVPLKEEMWYEQRIGTTAGGTWRLELMNANEAADWARVGQHGDKRVKGYSGLKAQILDHDSSSMLAISKGALDSVIWKTNLETCGLLSLSPDDAYLAYECDNSGLFVTDVRRLIHGVASPN
jgi:hypothetical protein